MKHLHFVEAGGSGGSGILHPRFTDWWQLFDELIKPWIDGAAGVYIRCALGYPPGRFISYGMVSIIMAGEDTRMQHLVETLPAFNEWMGARFWTLHHVGTFHQDEYRYEDLAVRTPNGVERLTPAEARERAPAIYRRWGLLNSLPFRGTSVVLDTSSDLETKHLLELDRLEEITGKPVGMEGRPLLAAEHLNTDDRIQAWMVRTAFNPALHREVAKIRGTRIALVVNPPDGVDPDEWRRQHVRESEEAGVIPCYNLKLATR